MTQSKSQSIINPEQTIPSRVHVFDSLMPYRVRDVLLVSSLYDSFIFEEDGQISELLLREYVHLNMWYAPRITRCPTGREAIEEMQAGRRYDLILATMRLGDMDPVHFASEVRKWVGPVPVLLLGYDSRELEPVLKVRKEMGSSFSLDRLLIWTGDARILLAAVNIIEDQRNVRNDTKAADVEVILFVEDSIAFASSYLPTLYSELMRQSQSLMTDGLSISEKVRRMRARPKILWCETYEQACNTYMKYRGNILGVISDVAYPREGKLDNSAGFKFTKFVRSYDPDMPVLLQSQDLSNINEAVNLDAAFAHKDSRWLPRELQRFMLDYFGFGPFVFRKKDGTEVDRAYDLRGMERKLHEVPEESLYYHAKHHHFSKWLKARTHFPIAKVIKPKLADSFPDIKSLRSYLVDQITAVRQQSVRRIIADYDPKTFDPVCGFARLGGGSIGGKARGLAFMNTLIAMIEPETLWPDIHLVVPPTVVIGTDYFDQFMAENKLVEFVQQPHDDEETQQVFRRSRLPASLERSLTTLVKLMDYPLAIRSSSMLEDSADQPFAGVYETYMITNTATSRRARFEELITAIKMVYASAFSRKATSYIESAPQAPDTEKMAVIIQKLAGRWRGSKYYPSFSGVARSYNYYPFGRMKSEDGVATVALGLGRTVVEGRRALRFCPKHPLMLPQFSSVEDILRNSQKDFYALELKNKIADKNKPFDLKQYEIYEAVKDGSATPLISTYSPENDTIREGIGRQGAPVVTFANILKHQTFPLPEIINTMLAFGVRGMSSPIEIEFAVDIPETKDEPAVFTCLQMRPLVIMHESVDIRSDLKETGQLVCDSPRALGNGQIVGIRDIIFVDPDQFERKNSIETANEVGVLNAKLRKEELPYMLIGPGRWGSSDPWLGIPVNWGQISGSKVVIETGLQDLQVTPSEGSHFFHNMTSHRVGYLTVNPFFDEGSIDWDWLRRQKTIHRGANGLRWVRAGKPMTCLIDGRSGRGVVVKSGKGVTGNVANVIK